MKRKILILSVVLAIALSALGVGYALWSDTLTIDGTINTGNVNIEWSAGPSYDSELPGKDVSNIECHVDYDPQSATFGQLIVTVTNAYPCIDYYQDVAVGSFGTVPVIISDVSFNTSLLPPNTTVEMLPASFGGYEGYPDIAVGVQLHENDVAIGTIHVHLTNDAEQGTTYTFTGNVTAVQYNEYTPPAP